ncbi:TPA: ABC transporter ATP-binding protein [Streptococcus pyogenes]|nr:ABC transporter ATP-binding protein [Streptococcus pyogenes]
MIESRPEFDKITSFDEFNKYYWYREELSGGQWQKIAIARTMYRKSSLLLFDEPSSSLDIISDRIIVMDNGKIVGDGSHDDLIENCNRYKLMYNKEFK